jgi:parallel beta-helix repeat protein
MTYKAAIAWEGAFGGESSIKDSVISSGRAIGIMIKNSANVKFVNNTIANFIQHGIWVKQS